MNLREALALAPKEMAPDKDYVRMADGTLLFNTHTFGKVDNYCSSCDAHTQCGPSVPGKKGFKCGGQGAWRLALLPNGDTP